MLASANLPRFKGGGAGLVSAEEAADTRRAGVKGAAAGVVSVEPAREAPGVKCMAATEAVRLRVVVSVEPAAREAPGVKSMAATEAVCLWEVVIGWKHSKQMLLS